MHKLDILAFGAHPDDVEISAGGSIIRAIQQGFKVGIVDLTRGELGSRGSAEVRDQESAKASKMLGIEYRNNLALKDGFFEHNEESSMRAIEMIRLHQPRIVLCPAPSDRHPDHGRSSKIIQDACFYSGLLKIETNYQGSSQASWRPTAVYSYIQDYYLKPDFVVDIASVWDEKIEILKCYSSQFYSQESSEPKTPISGADFFDFLKGRAMQMARPAGLLLAEGFITHRTPAVHSFDSIF